MLNTSHSRKTFPFIWFGSSSQHKSLLQGFCSTSNYVSQRLIGQFIESILQTSLIGIWLEFGIPNVPAVFWFCLSYNFVNLFNADIQRPFVLLNFILSVKWIEFNTVISYIVCACNSDISTMFSKPCDNNKHVSNDVQYFSKPGNTFLFLCGWGDVAFFRALLPLVLSCMAQNKRLSYVLMSASAAACNWFVQCPWGIWYMRKVWNGYWYIFENCGILQTTRNLDKVRLG